MYCVIEILHFIFEPYRDDKIEYKRKFLGQLFIDQNGYEFEEETETFVVSKYGARIFSVHELGEDSILQVRIKSSEHWSDFRIVWIGLQEDDSLGHVGIEFIQTTDFFGIIFPGEDWT